MINRTALLCLLSLITTYALGSESKSQQIRAKKFSRTITIVQRRGIAELVSNATKQRAAKENPTHTPGPATPRYQPHDDGALVNDLFF